MESFHHGDKPKKMGESNIEEVTNEVQTCFSTPECFINLCHTSTSWLSNMSIKFTARNVFKKKGSFYQSLYLSLLPRRLFFNKREGIATRSDRTLRTGLLQYYERKLLATTSICTTESTSVGRRCGAPAHGLLSVMMILLSIGVIGTLLILLIAVLI